MYVESDEYPGVRQPFNDNFAYGPQTFFQGVANSSNIYFFWLGGGYQEGNKTIFEGLGVDRLAQVRARVRLRLAHRPGHPRRAGRHHSRPDLEAVPQGPAVVQRRHLQHEHRPGRRARDAAAGGQHHQRHRQRRHALPAAPRARRSSIPTATSSRTSRRPQRRDRCRSIPANLAIMREAMEWGFEGPVAEVVQDPGPARGGQDRHRRVSRARSTPRRTCPPTAGSPASRRPTIPRSPSPSSSSAAAAPTTPRRSRARIFRRYFHLPDVPPDAPKLPLLPQPAPKPPAA